MIFPSCFLKFNNNKSDVNKFILINWTLCKLFFKDCLCLHFNTFKIHCSIFMGGGDALYGFVSLHCAQLWGVSTNSVCACVRCKNIPWKRSQIFCPGSMPWCPSYCPKLKLKILHRLCPLAWKPTLPLFRIEHQSWPYVLNKLWLAFVSRFSKSVIW